MDCFFVLFFKAGVKLLGATAWESLPGKEFNREKNQSRPMERKPTLEYLFKLLVPGPIYAWTFISH